MNKTENVSAIEDFLSEISKAGEEILNDSSENLQIGWYELNVGDKVYFKTFDDVNDIVTVSKGEIIEIIITEKKVLNKPDDNMESNGWHRERQIAYKVRWNGMTANIDPRYVYTDKMSALLAAVCGTIKSYFSL
jgi:hypothetical protein